MRDPIYCPKDKDTVNRAGAPAYKTDVYTATVSYLMTGSTRGTFYASGAKIAEEAEKTFEEMAQKDIEFLAQACVYARLKGYLKLMPIVGTVVVSKHSPEYFHRIAPAVCRIPSDWVKLIDVCRSKRIRQGVGTAIKKEIRKFIYNLRDSPMRDYWAIKYRSAFRYMILNAHVPVRYNPDLVRWAMNLEPSNDYFRNYKALSHISDPSRIAEAIRKYRYPFEVCTRLAKDYTEVWTALMEVAPILNAIRNVRTFARHRVFADEHNVDTMVRKLTSQGHIADSMIFPFRPYQAYSELKKLSLRNVSENDFPTAYRKELLNALEVTTMLSINNVPKYDGRIAILLDVSGSMWWTDVARTVRAAEVATLFAYAIARKCGRVVIVPFDYAAYPDGGVEIATAHTPIEAIERARSIGGGGTSLAVAMEYLIDNKIDVDRIIAITDNEEWLAGGYTKSFKDALVTYTRRVRDSFDAYLITVAPSAHAPVKFESAVAKLSPKIPNVNIYGVFGWSDNVLKFALSRGTQIDEIRECITL